MCLLLLWSGFGDLRGDGGVTVIADVFSHIIFRFW